MIQGIEYGLDDSMAGPSRVALLTSCRNVAEVKILPVHRNAPCCNCVSESVLTQPETAPLFGLQAGDALCPCELGQHMHE